MTITEQKKALRSSMLQRRGKIDPVAKQDYDQWICNKLEKIIREQNFKSVHAYIPMANEIDIRPLIEQLLLSGVTVICPKTLPKRKLENRILHSLDEVEIGIMGTKHPMQPEPYEGKPDLIIVPGLAFDDQKYRLGYGGGYYDNFLVNYPDSYKVGIFYPSQEIDIVPIEAHDIALDTVLVKAFE
jgi:5-formyltetrahydrofolate cyclo-ligase